MNPNLVAGPGRPKGVPNKLGMEIKELVEQALSELGGKDYLVKVAKKQPAVFCGLLGKLIPADLTITHKSILDDLSADELGVLRQALAGRAGRIEQGCIEGVVRQETRAIPALPETKDLP